MMTSVISLWFAASAPAAAQTFTSGSDGSDGALDLTGEVGTVIFDPVDFGMDVDVDNVYHFTSVTIPVGVTVRLLANHLNYAPVYWLSTGDVTIAGTLDLSGQQGTPLGVLVSPAPRSIPGPGGYPGGAGSVVPGTAFQVQVGGSWLGLLPGGVTGIWGSGPLNHTNRFLLPLVGGGGGGATTETIVAGATTPGGGAGGGAILIASDTTVVVSGAILAQGGAGGEDDPLNPNGVLRDGWGGAGGVVRVVTPTFGGTGSINTTGGRSRGICLAGFCPPLTRGQQGAIRIETDTYAYTGTLTSGVGTADGPALAPLIVPLNPSAPILPDFPTVGPRLVAVTVDGVDVSVDPSGTFTIPDVIVSNLAPVDIEIEAANVPLGTVIDVDVLGYDGSASVQSTELVGTLESSTATATISLPIGYSVISMRAVW